MEAEQSLRIVVTELKQPVADVLVDDPQALLGSAGHCDVRLGPDKVAPEQLVFEQRNGFVYAELRSIRPQVLLNMTPFHNGRIREDAVLTIGTLEIRATLEQRLGSTKKDSEKGVKPTFVAMIALLGVLLVVAILRLTRKEALAEAPQAPVLFSAQEKDKPCPEQTGEPALSAAYELIAQAESKRERAPFVPEDGLMAVPLYRTAALCLDVAEEADEARRVRKAADKLQAFVERDYHLHQVRVHRALNAGDSVWLAREVTVLSAYLKSTTGTYTSWLDHLQRDLDVQNDKKKKSKKKGK